MEGTSSAQLLADASSWRTSSSCASRCLERGSLVDPLTGALQGSRVGSRSQLRDRQVCGAPADARCAGQLHRQLQLCQSRRQAVCARYEAVLQDWQGWLRALRAAFALPTRPGFPHKVRAICRGQRQWQWCRWLCTFGHAAATRAGGLSRSAHHLELPPV